DRRTSAVAQLGGVVDELVEARGHKVVELHLANGTTSHQGAADTGANDGPFGDGGIEDAVTVFLEEGLEQQEGVAVGRGEVFADKEGVGDGFDNFFEALPAGVEEGGALGIEGRGTFDRPEVAGGAR